MCRAPSWPSLHFVNDRMRHRETRPVPSESVEAVGVGAVVEVPRHQDVNV